MLAIAIIPARYASVRFPGKVLEDRTGRPLIQHVYERVQAASTVSRVIVAADDRRIIKAVEDFGGGSEISAVVAAFTGPAPRRAAHPAGTEAG